MMSYELHFDYAQWPHFKTTIKWYKKYKRQKVQKSVYNWQIAWWL